MQAKMPDITRRVCQLLKLVSMVLFVTESWAEELFSDRDLQDRARDHRNMNTPVNKMYNSFISM